MSISAPDVVDFVKEGLNGSPKWRLTVSLLLVALVCWVTWGYFNYARAEDVNSLKADVNDIKVQLLSQSILSANNEKCEQEKAGKYSPYWQEQLSKLKREYFIMTGQSFELPPSC